MIRSSLVIFMTAEFEDNFNANFPMYLMDDINQLEELLENQNYYKHLWLKVFFFFLPILTNVLFDPIICYNLQKTKLLSYGVGDLNSATKIVFTKLLLTNILAINITLTGLSAAEKHPPPVVKGSKTGYKTTKQTKIQTYLR